MAKLSKRKTQWLQESETDIRISTGCVHGELRTQNIPLRIELSVLRHVIRPHTEYEVNFKIFPVMTSRHCRNSVAQTA